MNSSEPNASVVSIDELLPPLSEVYVNHKTQEQTHQVDAIHVAPFGTDEFVFEPTDEFRSVCNSPDCTHQFSFKRSVVRKMFPREGRVKYTIDMAKVLNLLGAIELSIPCILLKLLWEFSIGARDVLPSLYIRGEMDSYIPSLCRQYGKTVVAYLENYLGLDIRLCSTSYDADDEDESLESNLIESHYNRRKDVLKALPRDVCDECMLQIRRCECDDRHGAHMLTDCCHKRKNECECDIVSFFEEQYYI